jgi:hypothetical protein
MIYALAVFFPEKAAFLCLLGPLGSEVCLDALEKR